MPPPTERDESAPNALAPGTAITPPFRTIRPIHFAPGQSEMRPALAMRSPVEALAAVRYTVPAPACSKDTVPVKMAEFV